MLNSGGFVRDPPEGFDKQNEEVSMIDFPSKFRQVVVLWFALLVCGRAHATSIPQLDLTFTQRSIAQLDKSRTAAQEFGEADGQMSTLAAEIEKKWEEASNANIVRGLLEMVSHSGYANYVKTRRQLMTKLWVGLRTLVKEDEKFLHKWQDGFGGSDLTNLKLDPDFIAPSYVQENSFHFLNYMGIGVFD